MYPPGQQHPPQQQAVEARGLSSFFEETVQKDGENAFFELESTKMLEVNLNGETVMTKTGSMVGYVGNLEFKKQSTFAGGLGKFFKKMVSGEDAQINEVSGNGRLYLADSAKNVSIVRLQNETLNVQGNDVLAFQSTITHDVKMMKSLSGLAAGGLANIVLTGTGYVAFTCHGQPMTLRVRPGQPVITDPNATVAWSDGLQFKMETSSMTMGNLLRGGTGESISMKFEGEGFVVIQPYEEVYTVTN